MAGSVPTAQLHHPDIHLHLSASVPHCGQSSPGQNLSNPPSTVPPAPAAVPGTQQVLNRYVPQEWTAFLYGACSPGGKTNYMHN